MRYKRSYDHKTQRTTLHVGDWVLILFPQDESGRWKTRSWPGPYRIVDRTDHDVTCAKVYHPQDGSIRVHQSRICRCLADFPASYYWYGGKWKGPGFPPKWVDCLLLFGTTGVTQADSTDHPNTKDAESNNALEADTSMGEGDSSMEQHLRPQYLQPSPSQS